VEQAASSSAASGKIDLRIVGSFSANARHTCRRFSTLTGQSARPLILLNVARPIVCLRFLRLPGLLSRGFSGKI
jgi:hypothetical protein